MFRCADVLVKRIIEGKLWFDGIVPDNVCSNDQRHLPQIIPRVQINAVKVCQGCADVFSFPLTALEWPINKDTFDPSVAPNAVVGIPTWHVRSSTKLDLGTKWYAEA